MITGRKRRVRRKSLFWKRERSTNRSQIKLDHNISTPRFYIRGKNQDPEGKTIKSLKRRHSGKPYMVLSVAVLVEGQCSNPCAFGAAAVLLLITRQSARRVATFNICGITASPRAILFPVFSFCFYVVIWNATEAGALSKYSNVDSLNCSAVKQRTTSATCISYNDVLSSQTLYSRQLCQ